LVVIGAEVPVAYFADPDGTSKLVPERIGIEIVALPTDDVVEALEALVDALDARRAATTSTALRPPPGPAPGALTVQSVGTAGARVEGLIFVDEGVSSGGAFLRVAASCPPLSYLSLTGGATGQGLPCATGAAIACPGRKVIAFVGDGAAMYTIQSLWTQAREGLDVVTLVCANDSYRILELELARKAG